MIKKQKISDCWVGGPRRSESQKQIVILNLETGNSKTAGIFIVREMLQRCDTLSKD